MEGRGEESDGGGAATNVITNSDGSDAVTINIRRSNHTKFAVQVILESSVESFKSEIAKNCDVPAELQHLVYKGWLLKHDRTLKSYGIKPEHTVHLIGGFVPDESDNTRNKTEEGTISGSGVGGPSSSPFDMFKLQKLSISDDSSPQDLERSLQRLFDQLPKTTPQDLERIVQRLFQNPKMMPETFYRLTNDPDAMRSRILTTLQLNEVIHKHPEFASIITSPEIFRDLAEAVIYFELIREMKRYIHRSDGGGGGGGGAPVGAGGREIRDGEGNFDSTPDPNILIRLMENQTILIIQSLLTNGIGESGINRDDGRIFPPFPFDCPREHAATYGVAAIVFHPT